MAHLKKAPKKEEYKAANPPDPSKMDHMALLK
jgi:hypothetical protein